MAYCVLLLADSLGQVDAVALAGTHVVLLNAICGVGEAVGESDGGEHPGGLPLERRSGTAEPGLNLGG